MLLLLLAFLVERSVDGLIMVAAPVMKRRSRTGSLAPAFTLTFKNKRAMQMVRGALPTVRCAVVGEMDGTSQDWGLGAGFDFGTR